MCTHLLHVRWVLVLELASVRHCHVLEHLLLRNRNVSPMHGPRPILVHRLHLCRTRALVPHDLLLTVVVVNSRMIVVHVLVLRVAQLRRPVRVEQGARLVALVLFQMVHQLFAGGLRVLDSSPHVSFGGLVGLLVHKVVDAAADD